MKERKSLFFSLKTWILASIRETNKLDTEPMRNCQEDLLILHNMGLKGKAPKSESIIHVVWNPHSLNWIKVNIDDAAPGAPSMPGSGSIFRNCRGFVQGCFAFSLGVGFAFEAEILGFIIAVEYAYKYK